jgi:hypothetical protein
LTTRCANVRAAAQTSEKTVNLIVSEPDGSADFSDLYVHLLSVALDEVNSSLSPLMRERNLAAHVARGISNAGTAPGAHSPLAIVGNQGLEHEETTVL